MKKIDRLKVKIVSERFFPIRTVAWNRDGNLSSKAFKCQSVDVLICSTFFSHLIQKPNCFYIHSTVNISTNIDIYVNMFVNRETLVRNKWKIPFQKFWQKFLHLINWSNSFLFFYCFNVGVLRSISLFRIYYNKKCDFYVLKVFYL